jgi:beta-lactamase class A
MKKTHMVALAVVAVGVAVTGGTWTLHALEHDQSSKTHAIASRPINATTLHAAIERILAANTNLAIGISMIDLTTGQDYSYGESGDFTAASITKLITASMFLHEVEAGNTSLNDTIGDDSAVQHLERLIVESDNDSWQALDAVLTTKGLQAYADSLGLASYEARTNTVSSTDIASLLGRLYQNKLLNTQHTQLLLSYMARASQADYIVAAAPSGAHVYHKAGWLEDRLHDAAIIDDGTHAYALVIFTKSYDDDYDYVAAKPLFASITQAANQAFLNRSA